MFDGPLDRMFDEPFDRMFDGPFDGPFDQAFDRTVDRAFDGLLHGSFDGPFDEIFDGTVDGTFDGTVDGTVDGAFDGTFDGMVDGTVDGSFDGAVEGTCDREVDGTVDGTFDGTFNGAVDGTFDGRLDGTCRLCFWTSRILMICSLSASVSSDLARLASGTSRGASSSWIRTSRSVNASPTGGDILGSAAVRIGVRAVSRLHVAICSACAFHMYEHVYRHWYSHGYGHVCRSCVYTSAQTLQGETLAIIRIPARRPTGRAEREAVQCHGRSGSGTRRGS